MNGIFASIFLALIAATFCWEFPGHPGTDCPTTLKIMSEDPERRWMLPKCEDDRTFTAMQCFPGTTACMCVAADGSPLTLPGFVNVTACECFTEYYKMWLKDENSPVLPRCADDGTFKPLQCDKATGLCWCVDKTGHVLTKPSKDTKSC
uniref:U31-Theraphotoxin-Ct1c_1 n=1 Tax=Coremiocnemis tropix TaxID=1904443 RepID=A0A482ZBS8_CORTR